MIRFLVLALLVMISARAQGQTLGQALNATNLTWTTSGTGGAQGWIAQSTTTHDGVSAAMSGSVSIPSQSSTVQTTLTGPGTLSFWWRNPSGNRLTFISGSTTLASITSFPSWQQQTAYLVAGTHTLKWALSHLSPGDPFNRSYLDQVSYTQGATGPIITAQPPGQSQVPGMNATFTLGTGGTPPLSFQWQFNGTDLPGATAASLTVTNVQTTNLGNYRVVITNAVDSIVSSNAPLEFGEVTAWGANQLGQSTVPIGATNILAVAAGYNHNLALKSDGTLLAWGWNDFGQANVPEGLSNVTAIAGGNLHSLALKADGTVVTWGIISQGDVNVPPSLSNVVAVAAGLSHNLALKADGTVTAWGRNLFGQTNVPADLTSVVAITAGDDHNLALKRDGTVVAWGNGGFGKTNVPAGLTNVIAVEAGYLHSLALRSDRTIAAWGYDGFGLTTTPATATNVVAVEATFQHNLALRADGTVLAWGDSSAGRTNVPPGLTNVVAIAAGRDHSLALVGSGPPIVAGLVVNPAWSVTGFSVSLPTQCGRVFGLEYRESLSDPNWSPLPLVAGNGTAQTLRDTSAINATRFFRVRRW